MAGPCGCSDGCGCNVVAGTGGVSVLQSGNTFTVSVAQNFTGVADTDCIDLTFAAGVLSAAPIIDAAAAPVLLGCGASGLYATLVIDPASTATVTQSAAGLRVDVPAAAPIPLAIDPTVHVANAVLSSSYDLFRVDTTAGPVSVTVPSVSGRVFIVKDVGGFGDVNPVTIIPAAGLVDGAADHQTNLAWESTSIVYDGTDNHLI